MRSPNETKTIGNIRYYAYWILSAFICCYWHLFYIVSICCVCVCEYDIAVTMATVLGNWHASKRTDCIFDGQVFIISEMLFKHSKFLVDWPSIWYFCESRFYYLDFYLPPKMIPDWVGHIRKTLMNNKQATGKEK